MNQLQNWLSSSQDSTQVANKAKGVILFASSFIIMGAAYLFHITLSASDIVTLATEIGATAGAVWTVYGVVLNIITWVGTVRSGGVPVPALPTPVTVVASVPVVTVVP
jgi:hypothetical protein